MTGAAALADCILSGQVPEHEVPRLVADTPGLREEIERRSRGAASVAGQRGRGRRNCTTARRLLDPINLLRKVTLTLRGQQQKGGGPLKTRRLGNQLIRSFHPASSRQETMEDSDHANRGR